MFPAASHTRLHFVNTYGLLAARDIAQRLPDDFLGMTEPVDRGRVDPVETALDRAPNRRDGGGVVLRSPSESPLAANRPGAQADGSEFESRIAELSQLS